MVLYLELIFYPRSARDLFRSRRGRNTLDSSDGTRYAGYLIYCYRQGYLRAKCSGWNCFGGSYPARTVEAVNADGTVFTIPVTWESKPEYNATIAGEYIFFPIIPEAYSVAEGVEVPSVKITVLADKLLLVGETPTRYPVQKNLRQLSKKSPMEMKPSIQLFSKKILT